MTYSRLTDEYLPVYGKSYSPRAYGISKVTVHHMAGNLSIEDCQSVFNVPSRKASSNYGIGSDGRIGCYVPEEDAAWTSFSYWNDNQAITIEVADYDTSAWSPSPKAYVATVALCADICDRYGITPTYTGDTDGTFTEHMMYQATECPGPWWHDKLASGSFIQDVKNAMNGGFHMPIECILHPDESGMLFHVSGNSIEYIPHPDCVTALQDVAEACGQDIPYIDLGTKEAPWGWRFFQACGQGDLYERMVEGKQGGPFEPEPEPQQDGMPIMGESLTTAAQMAACFEDKGKPYPEIYAEKGAPTIADFCRILMEEAQAEGVRAEVVFAQAMHETGWLQFGGDVSPEQCNFAGIGATGGVPGNSFEDVRQGIRAQVQHLKAYASTDDLANECVDPRFHYIERGIAPTVEELGGRWAVGSHYGERIIAIVDYVLGMEVDEPEPEPEPEPERAEKLRYCIGVLTEMLEECE